MNEGEHHEGEPSPARQRRSPEERRQLLGIASTITVCALITAALVALAVVRIAGNDPQPTRIAVSAGDAASTLPPVPIQSAPSTTIAPTTTVKRRATTTTLGVTTTVAPTTTTTTVPPTTTTTAPATAVITWTVTPPTATVRAGASVAVSVEAANSGTADGSVMEPGCPAPPQLFARTAASASSTPTTAGAAASTGAGGVCAQGSLQIPLLANHYIKWNMTVSATTDATTNGAPLAPGQYHLRLGGATFTLIVI